jgi:hypothetical protein
MRCISHDEGKNTEEVWFHTNRQECSYEPPSENQEEIKYGFWVYQTSEPLKENQSSFFDCEFECQTNLFLLYVFQILILHVCDSW